MEDFSVVGKSVPLMDGIEKVTGEGIYGVDAKLPGMIHGRVLRSPYPHARILKIDTSEAECVPGVYAVVTAHDMPDRRVGISLKDEYIFAKEKVRYVGEAVAAVAAVDVETADRALQAIQVEYQELKPVFDALEARREGAPILHEDLGTYEQSSYQIRFMRPMAGSNIASHIKVRTGDITKGFQEAGIVLENSFRCHRIHHCYMEPHAVVADYKKDKITIWTNGQRTLIPPY
jgi:carbon-monoxide dehydrogenase large subunit